MRNIMRPGPAARRSLAAAAALSAAALAITTLATTTLATTARGVTARAGAGLTGAAPHRAAAASRPAPAARPDSRPRDGRARFPVPAGRRFAVLLDDNAEVVNMATGRILRAVRPPGTSREFLWVAAAASGRLFVLASRPRSGWLRFYVLRISRDGHAVSLRRVPLARRLHGQLTGLAVSPDGTRFAVSAWPSGSGLAPSYLFEGRLGQPGRGRFWFTRAGSAMNPSWTGNRQLAFGWWPARGGRPGLRIRGLTGTPRSPLAGSRTLAPGLARIGGQVTADGSAVLSVVVARDGRARLDELAPGSGRVRRSFPLAGPARPEARQDCAVLWASPTGRKIFTQCGQVQQMITGSQQRRVHLALTVPVVGYPGENTFAW
jgi:hypothetical protein